MGTNREPELPPGLHRVGRRGLIAVGGDLSVETLLAAYATGLFPWSSDPVLNWWSPDPRPIFDLADWRPHPSVARSARRGAWRFTVDADFRAVMLGCAEPAPGRESTWITLDYLAAYGALFRRGHAHSVEVWEGTELVGGIYGVAIGGFFGGESMFRRRTDASKAALGHLVERLRAGGFALFDAQAPNPHLLRLGARLVRRGEYLRRLRAAVALEASLSAGEGV